MCRYCNANILDALAINKRDEAVIINKDIDTGKFFIDGLEVNIPINYCLMCRKEARRVKVLKKGKYQKENIITCEKCGCEFQYHDTEIIVDMTTPDEESFLGGFGVHKYLKCPTCNAICTISTDFIEHKSIFTEIKEWWKDLFYASTSKEDKQ